VTLSSGSLSPVTVQFATADGTGAPIATQPVIAQNQTDYNATSGVLTFAPGETIKNVTVKIKGENVHERDEHFFVNLSNATGANILDGQGRGNIINDDQVPQITFHDVSAVENFNPLTVTVYPEFAQPPTFLPQGTPYTRPVSIFVTLSNPSSGTIVVDYQAIDETAVGRNIEIQRDLVDYRRSFPVIAWPEDAAAGLPGNPNGLQADPPWQLTDKVTFLPGEGSREIVLRIFKDSIAEQDETFILKGNLVTPDVAPAGLSDDTGRVTIIDDDAKPNININNSTVVEGDSGQTFLVFIVSLSGNTSEQDITVNYTTVAGTASPGVDYVHQTGTITLNARKAGNPGIPNERSKTISIAINGDFVDEADETLSIQLSNAVNGNIAGAGVGNGLILDDEGPVINISDVAVVEGDSGTVDAILDVTLSATSAQTVTVDFFTSNGSAAAGSDYQSNSGRVTFAPGVTTQQITVRVVGDTLFEGTEFFLVNLTTPDNATINDNVGQVSILNDDIAPTINISDASVVEGNSGQTQLLFAVTLTQASNATVGVDYATFSNSAQSGIDFASIASNLVFLPGEVSKNITVSIFGDTTVEPDEKFLVILSNPINGTIGDSSAEGTILDDDAPPRVTINDVIDLEPAAGTGDFVFTVSLSKTTGVPVEVVFATGGNSALQGTDFNGTSGTLLFNPGETAKQVTVEVLADLVVEGTEDFFVSLLSATQSIIDDNQGIGTIIDEDSPFVRIFDQPSIVEGNFGTTNAVFLVQMSRQEGSDVTVQFATANGSAVAGNDYTATSGILTFSPGETEKFVTVPILGDSIDEINENFFVNLSTPVGTALFDAQAEGIIRDDDGPTITIGDVAVTEGDAGLVFADFIVTLNFASVQTVTVNYFTADSTATGSGSDYFSTSGVLTFAPGQLTRTIRVNVLGDTIDELNETFFVNLTSPTNATIADGVGLGTITDDDAPGIFINDTQVIEEDSGLVFAVFQIGLTAATVQPVTVVVATQDGSALQNQDYFPTSFTVTFQPADPQIKNISIQIVPDSLAEQDEAFLVNLSNPTGGATLADPQAVGTIIDDDVILVVNDVTVLETNSSTADAVFTVSMSQPRANDVTVEFSTVDGTALAPNDYTPTSGTLTIAAGETTALVTVKVMGDTLDEPSETFDLVLSNPVGVFLGSDVTGTATIQDNNDPQPTLTIGNASQVEGNSGTVDMVFDLTLTTVSGNTIVVNYSSQDLTATEPADYNAVGGFVTFLPGDLTKQITVQVNGDTLNEPNHDFQVLLLSANDAVLGNTMGTGTIIDDDPAISINSITVTETNGSVNAVFNVSLDKPASGDVTVDFATAGNTATSGADFQATAGSLSFAAGEVLKQVTVVINGDMSDEIDETFFVNLSNVVGAASGMLQGTGTIIDEDPLPTISITTSPQLEGDSGTTNAVFVVTLSQVSGKSVTVNFGTLTDSMPPPGTAAATAGTDYQSASGLLSFSPGEQTKVVTVAVNGDLVAESNETFLVRLSSPVNATVPSTDARNTILDDEPRVSIADASINEGNSGTSPLVFTVSLTKAAGAGGLTIPFITSSGTAAAPGDFQLTSGNLTFDPGEAFKTITVQVNGDTLYELNETFQVTLSNSPGVVIVDGQAVGTIGNDDALPQLTVSSPAPIMEGDTGTRDLVFTVTLTGDTALNTTVAFSTATDTAGAGDFQATSGILTFTPGTTTLPVTVRVVGDTQVENNESFLLSLSSPVNAALGAPSQGTGTIVDDDPQIVIAGATVTEGDVGTVNAVFTVTLSKPTGDTVTANFTTVNGTAIAGSDFNATSGVLTFAAGETSKSITVAVNGDTLSETSETFTVNLSALNGAVAGTLQATGRINDNNDPLPSLSINDVTVEEGTGVTVNAIFTVTLSTDSGQVITVPYSTAGDSATADVDFVSANGVLTFQPGEVSKQITVQVVGDGQVEPTESFLVSLTSYALVVPVKQIGVGTITDNELTNLLVTGAGAGGGPHVKGYQTVTLNEQFSFYGYAAAFPGGVRVASADVNGDGQADIITVPGSGGGPHLRVFDGKTGGVVMEFFAFEPSLATGLMVAAGDVNFDGKADIFVSVDGPGSQPRARVFDGATGAVLRESVLPSSFSGGVRVAAGDINGDGRSDLIVAAAPGNTPRVIAIDVATGATLADFFAYGPGFTGGVYVAAGDINADGKADIITGAGPGGGPHVRVFDGVTRTEIVGFYAYAPAFTGGVRVGVTDFNSDGRADIITGAGPGGGPHVRVLDGRNLADLAGFYAYSPAFTAGVYVAGSFEGPGSPLRAAGNGAGSAAVNANQLQPLVDQAIANWAAARHDAELANTLRGIRVEVADLPGDTLALAFASAIVIDQDAAGHGWFVDSTPAGNEEFDAAGHAFENSQAAGRIDLLTVLAHEYGHALGLDDLDLDSHAGDLMAEALAAGLRRWPLQAVDTLFGDDSWQ
jgi:hypothetical protein